MVFFSYQNINQKSSDFNIFLAIVSIELRAAPEPWSALNIFFLIEQDNLDNSELLPRLGKLRKSKGVSFPLG